MSAKNSKATLAAPDFGSASVTIFFKPEVILLLDKLSPATKAIWAVNTMGRTGRTARAAIIALQSLGVQRIYPLNRTTSKGQVLIEAFLDIPIKLIEVLNAWPAEGPAPTVIVSTVPATVTNTNSTRPGSVLLPLALFDATVNGVVVDMACKPAETPLLTFAKSAASKWARVMKVEVLLEHGHAQLKRGRNADGLEGCRVEECA
ncbi:hypothetical protein EV424DRAFT_1351367 [Suillus variegatus]|nr:hypothetical protein EV424DRAFT_1351367 [Suillus variegatus]